MIPRRLSLWGVLWRSDNSLDGITSYLMYENSVPVLFRTREKARYWINEKYGYIRTRQDLKDEPHGWKIPIAVRVRVVPVETRGTIS